MSTLTKRENSHAGPKFLMSFTTKKVSEYSESHKKIFSNTFQAGKYAHDGPHGPCGNGSLRRELGQRAGERCRRGAKEMGGDPQMQ